MTVAAIQAGQSTDQPLPQRPIKEARRLMKAAVNPSAEFDARIQSRRLPDSDSDAPGWEFYEVIDQEPCHICNVPDAGGANPAVSVSSRYST